jgi:molybdopterin-guanine dinucleotide biosynthesis protein A/rhodanese-related sulfurtransferase
MSFVGVVLTGGASRRFGRDKAVEPIDNVPMARRVIEALTAAGAASVVTVGGPDRGFARHLPDLYPGEGPLGGVLSAFEQASADVVFVAACDLPYLDAETVRAVLSGLGGGGNTGDVDDVDAAVARTDNLEPLCGAYRRSSCEQPFQAAFDEGERSMMGTLRRVRIREVTITDQRALRNVNTVRDVPTALLLNAMLIPEISVVELAERRAKGATLFDVREPHEWEEVRVPGAVLVPLGTVPDFLDDFPDSGEVLVICRSGARSMRACEWLASQGRAPVNVAGGTLAWVAAGFETESSDGTSTS